MKMPLRALRASKTFTVFVVCVAVFSDVLLQNLVVPVLPYALEERVGLQNAVDVQWWNSVLLAAFGGAFMLGSCKCGFGIGFLFYVSFFFPSLFFPLLRFVDSMRRGNSCISFLVYVCVIECLCYTCRNMDPSTPNSRRNNQGKRRKREDPIINISTPTVCIGPIADRIPTNRTPFTLSLALAFASTLCFALGTTLPVLLSARLLEGLSTALVATFGYTLMRETVGQERLGRATGFSSMALSMGLLLGPVLGGVLYEYAGYFETFVPALVLLGAEVVLRLAIIENRETGSKGDGEVPAGDDDAKRTVAEEQEEANGQEGVVRTDQCSPSALESQPLLPPPPPSPPGNVYHILLTSPRFLTSLLGTFILNSTASGFDAVLPPYLLTTFSLGPINVAALFLALALPMLCSPLTGILTDRFGAKIVAASGLALGAPALVALGFVREGTREPMVLMGLLFFLIGVGLALAVLPLQVDATAAAAALMEKNMGLGERGACARAVGLVNGMVAAGGLVGPLAAGFLRIWIGWEGMAGVMGGLSLLVLGLVVVWTGGRKL